MRFDVYKPFNLTLLSALHRGWNYESLNSPRVFTKLDADDIVSSFQQSRNHQKIQQNSNFSDFNADRSTFRVACTILLQLRSNFSAQCLTLNSVPNIDKQTFWCFPRCATG